MLPFGNSGPASKVSFCPLLSRIRFDLDPLSGFPPSFDVGWTTDWTPPLEISGAYNQQQTTSVLQSNIELEKTKLLHMRFWNLEMIDLRNENIFFKCQYFPTEPIQT